MNERFIDNQLIEYKERQDVMPFVVSGDIFALTKQWADKKGYTLPSPEFFAQLRSDFASYMRKIFPGFEFVPEEELSNGLRELVNSQSLCAVSLDRTYYLSQNKIDINRLVDSKGRDKGLGRRANEPLLLRQFRQLKSLGLKEVALVDDVIFTGDLLVRVSLLLEKAGIKVPIIFAGIGIGEGIKVLQNFGRQVKCVRTYQEVIDEICERDFYPGVPLSGRLVAKMRNVGAPYILPFGNPREWASIPTEWQEPFSRFCLSQAIKLFEKIESVSDKPVKCTDLERNVVSLPQDGTRFVEALREVLYFESGKKI